MYATTFALGSKVSFDGKVHTIVRMGPRNELIPIPGVNLIGNAVILERDGTQILVYEWDLDECNPCHERCPHRPEGM